MGLLICETRVILRLDIYKIRLCTESSEIKEHVGRFIIEVRTALKRLPE